MRENITKDAIQRKRLINPYMSYIDESGVFGRLNTHIPQDFHYHSFYWIRQIAIDIGWNPTANEDVRKLLYEKVFNLQSAR